MNENKVPYDPTRANNSISISGGSNNNVCVIGDGNTTTFYAPEKS